MRIRDLRSDLSKPGEPSKPCAIAPCRTENGYVYIDYPQAREFDTVAAAAAWVKTQGGWFANDWVLIDLPAVKIAR